MDTGTGIEIGKECEVLSDTNYGSDYNEVFGKNGLEFNGQTPASKGHTPAIEVVEIHSSSESSSETDYGSEIDKLFQNDTLLNSISRRSHDGRNFSSYQSNDTSSMVNFDMLRSSPPSSPSGRDHFFLTSAANWEPASTREISIKVKEVERVRQVINTHFNLKARPWQVGAVVDITKRKRDVCAIAGTNSGKNLVYQSIPVITEGSVLVILPAITLMVDQVCITPKMLYIHYLHLIV